MSTQRVGTLGTRRQKGDLNRFSESIPRERKQWSKKRGW